jgi:hypothetical protein
MGEMYLNGKFFCYTLEDKERDLSQCDDILKIKNKKIYGQTAIPKGQYKWILTYSNKLNQNTPELLEVKGFNNIRIHAGNTEKDTLGCILVGYQQTIKGIWNSQCAFYDLMKYINTFGTHKGVIIIR